MGLPYYFSDNPYNSSQSVLNENVVLQKRSQLEISAG